MFTRPAGGWATGTQTAKLTAKDGATDDELGFSVAVSADGSTVVAGANGATVSNGARPGAVYVFTRPAAGWSGPGTQTAKLTATDGATNDALGDSVAVSADGSTTVAGAPGANSHEGVAYVFVAVPPTLSLPPDGETVEATGPTGAMVSYSATASDCTGRNSLDPDVHPAVGVGFSRSGSRRLAARSPTVAA